MNDPPWYDDKYGVHIDDWLADLAEAPPPYELGKTLDFDTWSKMRREAIDALGVEVVSHCHIDSLMYGLAAKASVTQAWRGYPQSIDIDNAIANVRNHDAILDRFIETAGLPAAQLGPRGWWLVSYWG